MYNKSKNISFFTLISLEFILILVIIFLANKIVSIKNGSIKGVQYVSVLKKEDYIKETNTKLKYFYEPKPNNEIIENPEWLGIEIRHKINSDTLHEEKDYQIDKKNNIYRIITLGDSWTYGLYVQDNENYSKLLETYLNKNLQCKNYDKFEVLNLGVGGYDIAYSVERFLRRGIKYNPDLTIWFVNNWDFDKINDLQWQARLDLQGKGLSDYNPITKKWIISDYLNTEVLRIYGKKFLLDYQQKSLFKISDLIKSKLLITSIDHINQEYKLLINSIVKSDPSFSYFPIKNKSVGKLMDGHPNAQGHSDIAIQLFNYITKALLPNCNKT